MLIIYLVSKKLNKRDSLKKYVANNIIGMIELTTMILTTPDTFLLSP